jgi:UMF1 family MFS transporter
MNKIETLPGLRPGVARREVWAWAMYDFANSGYTTVVITAIFNAYFVAVIAGGAAWGTFAWTAALAVSYAAILLTAPFVGAWADTHGAKKRLLALTTAGCVLGTAGLALAGPGAIGVAIGFLVLSNYCFGTGENLIAAFLPELADDDSLGKVSGWGWSLGYLGGLTSLGACLAYIAWAEPQGHAAADYVPVTMLITALLFAVASVPTFLLLRERKTARATAPIPVWARVASTLRQLRGSGPYRDMRRFMVCVVLPGRHPGGDRAGGHLRGRGDGFHDQGDHRPDLRGQHHRRPRRFRLRLLAGPHRPSAGNRPHAGRLDRDDPAGLGGDAPALVLARRQYRRPVPGRQPVGQPGAGGLPGAAGPPRRVLRAVGLAVKLSSILGPLTYGAVTWLSGGDHRLAILITGSYFVVGLVILAGVDAERGHRSAQA